MKSKTRRMPLWVMVASLLLSGCAATSNLVDKLWWSDDEEKISDYIEPKPGRGVGLEERWSRSIEGTPDEFMIHPRRIAVGEGSVFVGTFEGAVVRVDLAQGKVLWRHELGAAIVGGVAVDEQRVFAGTVEGEMVALSRQTGEPVWRTPVSTKVASAPLAVGGRVVFTTLDNRTYALDAEKGERVWTHASVPVALVVQGAATPTSDGRVVYVGYATGEVFALKLSDGGVVWGENFSRLSGRSELDRLQDVDAEVVIGSEGMRQGMAKIFIVNHQGSVMALHGPSGSQLWRQTFSAIRSPLLWSNRLFLSNVEGQVVSMGEEDGAELWRVKVSDGLLTAPVRLGDLLLVADNKGRLMTLDPLSGRVVGLDKLGDPVEANPVVEGDTLLLWTHDGELINYRVGGQP